MSQHSASPPAAETSAHEDEGGPAMAVPEGAVPVHPMMAAPLAAQEYPQRKRVRLACSNCHRGKIKCDGERPCDRCLKKGLAPEECIDFQRKRTACTSCRAVKMKCDGNRPCKRCVKKGKGEECTDVDLPGVRPRREHRLKHNDGSVDDEHRPIPYSYDASAAAVAGYYYGAPPPWAYHPHHAAAEAPWHPYMYPYPQPPQNGEEEGRRGEYTAPMRSSYPDMPVDPALDPELLRQAQQSGQQPNMPAGASEGWSNILRTAQANGFYAQNGEGEAEGEDGEEAGEGGGEEGEGEGGEGDAEAAAEVEVKDEEENDEE